MAKWLCALFHWYCVLHYLMFRMLKQFCVLLENLICTWYIILLLCCLDLLIFYKGFLYLYSFRMFVYSFLTSGWIGSFFLLWKNVMDWYHFFFKCEVECLVKSPGSVLFFVGSFLITKFIPLLVIALYRFSTFCYISLGNKYICINVSISSKLFNLLT